MVGIAGAREDTGSDRNGEVCCKYRAEELGRGGSRRDGKDVGEKRVGLLQVLEHRTVAHTGFITAVRRLAAKYRHEISWQGPTGWYILDTSPPFGESAPQ